MPPSAVCCNCIMIKTRIFQPPRPDSPKAPRHILGATRTESPRLPVPWWTKVCWAQQELNRSVSPFPGGLCLGGLATKTDSIVPSPPPLHPPRHERSARQKESGIEQKKLAKVQQGRIPQRNQEVCRAHQEPNHSGSPCPGGQCLGGLATKTDSIVPSPPPLHSPRHERSARQKESGIEQKKLA